MKLKIVIKGESIRLTLNVLSGLIVLFALAGTLIGQTRKSTVNNQAGTGAGSAISDFDGDGQTDVAVFRPNTGIWYISQSMSGSQRSEHFGSFGDTVTPGDFDGDGKWDVAVWRSGTFYVLQSTNNTILVQQWGQPGDDARVVRDYDGDGTTDFAVYRRGSTVSDPSFWFILQSLNGIPRTVHWGTGGDVAAPADYDGDGHADISVYSGTRPTGNNTYLILRSSDSIFQSQQLGTYGADVIIVEGDYNGDGKDDFSTYRFSGPDAGTWYILTSPEVRIQTRDWGAAGDAPAPGDYDGDGHTDLAVFRTSTGVRYILRSSDSTVQIVHWGQAGDILTTSFTLR